ncbi:MAG: thiamine pyrophosphate-binding protein [Acidobacteriota bacterium]|nr:thiamine pyrophosphate-binding protein [Acidobacteriota bacterium]
MGIRSTIGGYLRTRLSECGIDAAFGVPGDFNLVLLERLLENDDLCWVGNCNELNAAYAADGYARMKGAAALVITYGVGDLSALNGIAGAFAEHVPVICISGVPPLHAIRQRMMLHHTSGAGNIEDVMGCMAQFTAAQARITPANAAREIDRLLETAMREKRPVYLQVPCDIVNLEIEAPSAPLNLAPLQSDRKQLERAVGAVAERLENARRPAILIDGDAHRFGLRPLICELGQTLGVPFAALASGRTIFDEQHPLYRGIYAGVASTGQAAETVEQSDCLLAIGVRFFDITTGLHTHNIDDENLVAIDPFSVSVDGKTFEGVGAADVLRELNLHFGSKGKSTAAAEVAMQAPLSIAEPQASLSYESLWQQLERFLEPGDVVIAESGTSSASIGGIRLPAGSAFIHQTLWASIGYALPAMLGSMLAQPARRHVLFIGDGSVQMTAQELSTMFRCGLKPVIFVINNAGYTIERAIYGREAVYNDIQSWDYRALPEVFRDGSPLLTVRAATQSELQVALEAAQRADRFTLIEVMLEKTDMPKGMVNFGKRVAEFNFGGGEQ